MKEQSTQFGSTAATSLYSSVRFIYKKVQFQLITGIFSVEIDMAVNRPFLNINILGIAFMLIFTAFQTMGNIQVSGSSDKDNC